MPFSAYRIDRRDMRSPSLAGENIWLWYPCGATVIWLENHYSHADNSKTFTHRQRSTSNISHLYKLIPSPRYRMLVVQQRLSMHLKYFAETKRGTSLLDFYNNALKLCPFFFARQVKLRLDTFKLLSQHDAATTFHSGMVWYHR